jgi:hypothetical protein
MDSTALKALVRIAKGQKQLACHETPDGEFRPVIVPIVNDQPWLVVIASGDRDEAIKAIAILRHAFDPDAIVYTADTCQLMLTHEPDSTVEDADAAYAAFRAKYGDAPLQDLMGKTDPSDPQIQEALSCLYSDRAKTFKQVNLPYTYESGKPDSLKWLEADNTEVVDGYVIEVLRRIWDMSPATEHPEITGVMDRSGFSPERVRWHMARAAARLLEEQGYGVFDLATPLHPEWIGDQDPEELRSAPPWRNPPPSAN